MLHLEKEKMESSGEYSHLAHFGPRVSHSLDGVAPQPKSDPL